MSRSFFVAILIALCAGCAHAVTPPYPSPSTPLSGAEVIPCWQAGVTKNCTTADIAGVTSTSPPAVPASSGAYPANWFSDFGGKIGFLNDRLFVNACTANTGSSTSTADWLSGILPPPAASSGAAQNSAVCIETTNGLVGLVSASQALNAQATGTPIVGSADYVFVDNAVFGNLAYSHYSECDVITWHTGSACVGIEIDAVNVNDVFTPSTTITPASPYGQPAGNYLFGIQLACGGGQSTPGNCDTALNIANNNASFRQGIIFDSTALTRFSGQALAIGFYEGDFQAWVDATGNRTGFVASVATTHTTGGALSMFDGGVDIQDAGIAPTTSVQLSAVTNAADLIALTGAVSGANNVGISASGSDTNISITVTPKGTGALKSSTSVAATTYVRPGQVIFANLGTVDPAPQVGDMLNITDASVCTANTQVTAGSGTTHSCPVTYNGVGWFALVTH